MRPTTPPCPPMLALAVCLLTAGCRFLGNAPPADGLAAATDLHAKPPTRTLHVEVLFVRCDPHDRQLQDELWTFVDETAVGDALVRRLNANGIRAGIVTGQLPEHLRARFAAPATSTAETDPADATVSRRLLQLLPGRRSEIVTAPAVEELVMLEHVDDAVRGATYRGATALLAVEVEPAADGRTRITAVPELKHGPMEKSWVGEDGSFRMETGQRRMRMEPLGIDVTLPRQGMLVIGSAGADAATVGDGLLRERGRDGRETMRLVAIRPLAGGVDPTFAPVAAAADSGEDSAPLVVR
jgi:hypothetical protein